MGVNYTFFIRQRVNDTKKVKNPWLRRTRTIEKFLESNVSADFSSFCTLNLLLAEATKQR